MADVSVQMGVSGVSQFKQGMAQAQASVKSIDAALKLNEKQFKATGDAETYMQNKTTQLNQKLVAQQSAVKNAEQALKAMKDSGVDPLSVSYQKMETQLLNAQSALLDTQNEINNLGAESTDAAGKTDQLVNSLGGLNKKVSLDQVISAIGSITSGMEKAAQKAAELGKQIWENITDSARWADDTATQAMILNMDVETYQRYKGVFDTIGELTVQEWQKAKLKVQKAINDPTKDQTDVLALLGINTHEMLTGKYGVVEGAARDFEDVFWEIGEKLRAKVASGEMTQDLADTYANAIFGRGFAELNPMFALGKEGFAAALEEQTVASEEAIQKDAELNDKLIQLQNSFTALKAEVTSGLAPALTAAADTINQLLQRVMEYLQSPEGQEAMANLEKAVTGLFEDLSTIDPGQVVQNFATLFQGIVESFTWLTEHWEEVKNALAGIAIGFGMLKVTSLGLNIVKMIDGFKTLFGGGGGGNGGTPTGTGAGGGSGVWLTATKLASNLASNLTMYDPTGSAALIKDSVMDLTTYGWERKTGKSVGEALRAEWGEITKGLDAEGIAASAEEARRYWFEQVPDAFWGLFGFKSAKEGATKVSNNLSAMNGYVIDREITADEAMRIINGEPIDLVLNPVVEENAEESIQEQVGTVTIPVNLAPQGTGLLGSFMEAALSMVPGGSSGEGHGFANGLWSVPFDGYRAILHKGERVVPAREVGSSRNFSSNLYVESMYMNNGQDADGLAAAMAAAQRRTMSGYGS